MEDKEIKNFHPADNCPVREVLNHLGDKWSMLVLLSLDANGTLRFGDIERSLSDISPRMLTVSLRTLEADGLVSRKAYAEIPPRVEYCLSGMGKDLMPHIRHLVGWAQANMPYIMEHRQKEPRSLPLDSGGRL